ncbi:hypothetical protein ACFLEY_16675 [Bradyrhizobium sp. YCK136]|uniref:hypothetical protein n=1 Tax=Bradyrhizobium sp. YCK136 TaxID=3351346 RepID=UPI0037C895BF
MVGYSDQSTFFRATHCWFGESPGEYRARVTAGHGREMLRRSASKLGRRHP